MEDTTFRTDNYLRVEEMSDVKVEKDRIDGKKPREFYTLAFSDAANPLKLWRTRNFFQHHSPDGTEAYWRGANPADAKAMVGSKIKGEMMKVPVEPYEIIDGTGVSRTVNNFTIIVFDGDDIPSVVRSYGHLLAGQLNSIGISRTDIGSMPSTEEQQRQSRENSRNARISDRPAGGEGEDYPRQTDNLVRDPGSEQNAPHVPDKPDEKTLSQMEEKKVNEPTRGGNDPEKVLV
jgi:hypothetical protein